jgi:hypothetical protein
MPDNENEYPPQFASSDLSSLLGQINDFAGVPPPPPPPGGYEMASAKGAAAKAAPDGAARLTSGTVHPPVPVSIVGSQAQRGPYLPGLKDLLIGVTYLRLAEQITVGDSKQSAQKLAQELILKGTSTLGAHIAKQQRAGSKKK